METTNIYILIDPRTSEVRYVGKANNVSERYKAHLNRARKHQTHKKNWITSLKKVGLKPIMEVVDIVPIEEWQFWEMYWISQMRTWGFNLVNHTYGGEGSTFGNQTSFKKGNIPWIQGKSHSDKTRQLLRDINLGNKHSDETKEKMSDKKVGKKPPYMEISGMTESVLNKLKPTQFKNGGVPWNKNISGYKLGGKKVLKYSLDNVLLGEFDSLTDAANSITFEYGGKTKFGNADLLSIAIRKKNGLYKNFIWKYKN